MKLIKGGQDEEVRRQFSIGDACPLARSRENLGQ